ncbi:carbohydrate ABC transporter permease [Oceaniglobus trochenteri]|uniref:carbohydrate ABC transporter permease n=1 Tax=Oceaniglobus trochenteri TaxID=2763260 RepID=UPI001CFF94BD|nr:carbohydrate ABC transporter permease [Oceaniglobus trochenteri]
MSKRNKHIPVTKGQATTVRIIWMIVSGILGILILFPLLWMVSIAFRTSEQTFTSQLIAPDATLANFVHVFTEVPFLLYMWNSFFVSTMVTVIALFFHTMAGYALARLRFPGREFIFLAIFSTFLVSLPVIIVPLFVIVKSMGMLNSYAGLIIPAIFNAFGIFLLRQYYLSIPREIEEAALIDGASYWRIYLSIILPLSKPIMSALAILFFLTNWNSFLWPLTIASDPSLWMVQVGIANFSSQYAASWNYMMAASTVVAIPTLVLFIVFQKQIMDSLKTSGLK